MADSASELITLNELSRKQRRVLGVLLEKAFTVPDQYPMTLKGITTGCNQKNNRDPVSNYSEEDVADTLTQLQQIGLVGCLHTEGGRTERYRHYMRHKTRLSEPQLAIMTELLLRGRQQLGELRTRASRMVPIETQEVLRLALQGLQELDLVQANGRLERRGIEVDHNLYPSGENHDRMTMLAEETEDEGMEVPRAMTARPVPVEERTDPGTSGRVTALEDLVRELKDEINSVRSEFRDLQDKFEDLRRQLGS
ncbi:MAG: DUF480 domain-containing protein [Planctomycetes bacterium]|nr:DUF480 domain-containing protein [Planctomycetota bacterium]